MGMHLFIASPIPGMSWQAADMKPHGLLKKCRESKFVGPKITFVEYSPYSLSESYCVFVGISVERLSVLD